MFKIIVTASLLATMSTPVAAANQDYCKHYAQQAVWQYNKSLKIPKCYQGDNAVWTPDFQHHYQWCLSVPEKQARAGDDTRGQRLHQCNMAAYGHP